MDSLLDSAVSSLAGETLSGVVGSHNWTMSRMKHFYFLCVEIFFHISDEEERHSNVILGRQVKPDGLMHVYSKILVLNS